MSIDRTCLEWDHKHCGCWPKRACCRCSTPGTLAKFPRPNVDLPPRKIKDVPQS